MYLLGLKNNNRQIGKPDDQRGVLGQHLKWMKDLRYERQMSPVYSGKHSSWSNKRITKGIDLAPILFIVFNENKPRLLSEYVRRRCKDTTMGNKRDKKNTENYLT